MGTTWLRRGLRSLRRMSSIMVHSLKCTINVISANTKRARVARRKTVAANDAVAYETAKAA